MTTQKPLEIYIIPLDCWLPFVFNHRQNQPIQLPADLLIFYAGIVLVPFRQLGYSYPTNIGINTERNSIGYQFFFSIYPVHDCTNKSLVDYYYPLRLLYGLQNFTL